MGSSMGGFVSLLFLSQYENNIKSLITIATPVNLKGLFSDNIDDVDISKLPEQGFTNVQGIELKNTFFKEIENINIEPFIKKIKIPLLLIHGSDDQVVSISNVNILKKLLKNNTEANFVIIEKGDHSLTGESDLNLIKENIQLWLKHF